MQGTQVGSVGGGRQAEPVRLEQERGGDQWRPLQPTNGGQSSDPTPTIPPQNESKQLTG